MADVKEVIDGLEMSYKYSNVDENNTLVPQRIVLDAIDMLKKQEPVEPKLVGVNTWICGECDALLGWEEFSPSGLDLVNYKYCPNCGKAVKWNNEKENRTNS